MIRKIRAWTSAFKAGAIAHKCNDCIVNDELEEIFPCPKHEAYIAHLAKINEENQPQ